MLQLIKTNVHYKGKTEHKHKIIRSHSIRLLMVHLWLLMAEVLRLILVHFNCTKLLL